jgi:hypothetical protein
MEFVFSDLRGMPVANFSSREAACQPRAIQPGSPRLPQGLQRGRPILGHAVRTRRKYSGGRLLPGLRRLLFPIFRGVDQRFERGAALKQRTLERLLDADFVARHFIAVAKTETASTEFFITFP